MSRQTCPDISGSIIAVYFEWSIDLLTTLIKWFHWDILKKNLKVNKKIICQQQAIIG